MIADDGCTMASLWSLGLLEMVSSELVFFGNGVLWKLVVGIYYQHDTIEQGRCLSTVTEDINEWISGKSGDP